MSLRIGIPLVCVSSAIAFIACGGGKKHESIPTATEEQLRQMEAIPDLSCQSCPAKAEVAGEEKLTGEDAKAAIDANKDAAGIYAFAGTLGYHDVLQGQKTTYSDGSVINSAVIQSDEKGVAVLATRKESTSHSVLIRLDPDNADQLIVTDGKGGSATVTWSGELIGSQETHSSCHYWDCVGSAAAWLYSSDTWYSQLLSAICHQCAEDSDAVTCGGCLAVAPSGLLAAAADCGIDPCDYCEDDSCGDNVFKSRSCRVDPSTVGEGLTAIYDLYEASDQYHCNNPGTGDSQCVMDSNVQRLVQVCPGDCGADGMSCAQAALRTCDPAACGARSTVSSAYTCQYRHLMRWTWYEVWWTGRTWSCQPDGAGGSVCVPGAEGSYYSRCESGWGCSGGVCTPPTATPTRTPRPGATATPTPLPICDPATCNREEAEGDPRCAYSYGEEGYIVEQDFREYTCQPQASGGSACDYTTNFRTVAHCPYGCAADGKSCAQPSAVPAAPTEFIALQHTGGTEFQWQDNSSNEQGFHVYFGARSLGRPSTLIATAAPNTSEIDTTFVRSGTETCWEIYAFNAAGESAPAHYCLPP